jgi:hypothetical protein
MSIDTCRAVRIKAGKKRNGFRLIIIFFIAGLGSAHGQFAPPAGGCPPGMYLQGFSCVYNQAPRPAPAPPPPAQQWVPRWGAIAIGSTASGGGFGTSIGMSSKNQAEEEAVEKCKSARGGEACKAFAYRNQCAVVAWGTRNYTIQSAESIEIASELALDDCSAKTTDCQLFYSGCSLPARIR